MLLRVWPVSTALKNAGDAESVDLLIWNDDGVQLNLLKVDALGKFGMAVSPEIVGTFRKLVPACD